MEDVHQASLEVLWRTGTRVNCEEAVALLKKGGAMVTDGNLVRIPPHLVEWALRCAPPRVPVANRNGERVMILEGRRTYYGTGSDCPNIIDPFTGERRKFLESDVANAARLCDALPNITFVMSMGLASDVPEATSDRHQFEAMVTNTVKPIVLTAHDLPGLRDIVRIAAAAVGGMEQLSVNPFIILYAEPITPLSHSQESIEKLLFMAENHLPVIYAPGMLRGGTAPATLAGCMTLANAEALCGITIAQLKREGAPVIYGGGAIPLDMRTAVPAYGSPDLQMTGAALAEMAHRYRLPRFSSCGASDSKVLDQQAMIEGTFSTMVQAMSGANLVHDVGYLESGLTGSFEMLVAMHEVIGMVQHFMGGAEINDETLAVDVIDRVGPGGNFLMDEHTLKHYKECFFPHLLDRHNYDGWVADGSRTMGDRLNARVTEILEEHKSQLLEPAAMEQIRGIVSAADGGVRA